MQFCARCAYTGVRYGITVAATVENWAEGDFEEATPEIAPDVDAINLPLVNGFE